MARRAGLALGITFLTSFATPGAALAAGTPSPRSATQLPSPVVPAPVPLPTDRRFFRPGAAAAPAARPTRPGPAWSRAAYLRQPVRWSLKNCPASTRALSTRLNGAVPVECAQVRTPLDWTNLRRGSIILNVTRVAHSTSTTAPATTARTLFVNPGGPGGAAGQFTVGLPFVKPALRQTHDIVGVDPRGAGGSTPLPCTPYGTPIKDSRVATPRALAAQQREIRRYVRSCTRQHSAILPYITTANTVADHDLVRRLLSGNTRADWYGVSGGSWMGAWYAHLFPKSLDRVVLDANTRFTTDWRTSFAGFPHGFQRRFDAMFLPWTARHDAQFHLGRTATQVRASYERVRAAAARGRVTGMDPDTIDLVLGTSMYNDAQFVSAATFLGVIDTQLKKTGRAVASVPESLRQEETPEALATATTRMAILCNDTPFVRTPSSFQTEFARFRRQAPLLAGVMPYVTGVCAYWPYRPTSAPKIDGTRGPMKLMVQTELDPATPVEGAVAAHRADRRTRLLLVDDEGAHGGYLSPNRCADGIVTGYLNTGRMPARDTTCAGSPLPGDPKTYRYTTPVTPR